MIDRAARDRVAELIEKFLTGEIGAFAFDEKLIEITSQDETVRHAVFALWFLYDDLIDHRVNLTREGWNYAERLRLLLLSEAELLRGNKGGLVKFGVRSVIVGLIVAFMAVGWWYLPGEVFWTMYVLAALGTGAGMLHRMWNVASTRQRRPSDAEISRAPFESFAQLRDVRRSVASFRKVRPPRVCEVRLLRPRWKEALMVIPWMAWWPLMVGILVPLGRGKKDVVVFGKSGSGIAGNP